MTDAGRGRIGRLAAVLGLTAAIAVAAVASSTSTAPALQPGDADAGSQVYQQHCAMCHGDDATGMMGMHPSLRGAVPRLTVEGVEVTIRAGRATTPPMPSFDERLTDDEITDVIAYLGTLPEGPRNFGPEGDGMGDMGGGMGMGGGMMDGISVWMLAFVALVAGLLGYLVGHRRARRRGE